MDQLDYSDSTSNTARSPEEGRSTWQRFRWLIVAAVTVVVILLMGGGYLAYTTFVADRSYVYTIPNVPYSTIFNHSGKHGYVNTDTTAAMLSVMDYWLELSDNEFISITNSADEEQFHRYSYLFFETIEEFIEQTGELTAEVRELSMSEVKEYVNSEERTPLLVYLRASEDQPLSIPYAPLALLVGVDEENEELIFHHFWYGHLYRLSFSTFKEMQETFTDSVENRYVVVRPVQENENANDQTHIAYSSRTEEMDAVQPLIESFVIARATTFTERNDDALAKAELENIYTAENFEENLHPYFKTLTLTSAAELALREDNLTTAHSFIERAVSHNKEFTEPFEGWGPFEVRYNGSSIVDEISRPYEVLGDILRAQENTEEARAAYEEALRIAPNSQRAQAGLAALEEME